MLVPIVSLFDLLRMLLLLRALNLCVFRVILLLLGVLRLLPVLVLLLLCVLRLLLVLVLLLLLCVLFLLLGLILLLLLSVLFLLLGLILLLLLSVLFLLLGLVLLLLLSVLFLLLGLILLLLLSVLLLLLGLGLILRLCVLLLLLRLGLFRRLILLLAFLVLRRVGKSSGSQEHKRQKHCAGCCDSFHGRHLYPSMDRIKRPGCLVRDRPESPCEAYVRWIGRLVLSGPGPAHSLESSHLGPAPPNHLLYTNQWLATVSLRAACRRHGPADFTVAQSCN